MSLALANIINPVISTYNKGKFIFLHTLVSSLLGSRVEYNRRWGDGHQACSGFNLHFSWNQVSLFAVFSK